MPARRPTMIELRDYATGFCAIRRPSSELGDYDAVIERCFGAFNRDFERFSLHFHFRQHTSCEDEELLRKREWDNGTYEIGGGTVYYAHFVRRVPSRSDARGGNTARESTTPPVIPSPESSTWTQPPLPTVYDQGLLSPVYPVPVASGPAPTPVPRPAQPSPAVRRPATQHRNTNSTTVYSLCTPIPSTRYANSAYFSGPWIFIPLQPAPPRPRSHPQRYTAPFQGFRSQQPAPTTGTAMASTPARLRPSAPAAVRSPSLVSHQQSPDHGFTDRRPATGRRRPGADEQLARPTPPPRDESDFDLESDDASTALQPASTRRRRAADEVNFALEFDELPAASQQPHWQQQDEQEVLEEEGEEERASVARSEDSSGLFVTNESERDFEGELAWEDDDEAVVQEDVGIERGE